MKKIIGILLLIGMIGLTGCGDQASITSEFLPNMMGSISLKVQATALDSVNIMGGSLDVPSRLIITVYQKVLDSSVSRGYTEVMVRETIQNLVWDETKGAYQPVYGNMDNIPVGTVRVKMSIEEYGFITYTKEEYVDVKPGVISPLNKGETIPLSFSRTVKSIYFTNSPQSGNINSDIGTFEIGFKINNVSGKTLEAGSTLTVVSSSSTGKFSVDNGEIWTSSLSVTPGTAIYVPFKYNDPTPGTHTLTASSYGWQSGSQTVTVIDPNAGNTTPSTGYYDEHWYTSSGTLNGQPYNLTVNCTQSSTNTLNACVFLWRETSNLTPISGLNSTVPRFEIYNNYITNLPITYDNTYPPQVWVEVNGSLSPTWVALNGGAVPAEVSNLTNFHTSRDLEPSLLFPSFNLSGSSYSIYPSVSSPINYQSHPIVTTGISQTAYYTNNVLFTGAPYDCGPLSVYPATQKTSVVGVHPEISYSISNVSFAQGADNLTTSSNNFVFLDNTRAFASLNFPTVYNMGSTLTELQFHIYNPWSSDSNAPACMYFDKSNGTMKMGFFRNNSNGWDPANYLCDLNN